MARCLIWSSTIIFGEPLFPENGVVREDSMWQPAKRRWHPSLLVSAAASIGIASIFGRIGWI